MITGFAALSTPTQLYPRGHRWPADALRFEWEMTEGAVPVQLSPGLPGLTVALF